MSRADSFNPYESPRAEIAARAGEYAKLPPAEFSVGEAMSRGWAAFQSRMGLSIGVVALGFLINVGLNLAQTFALAMLQASGTSPGALGGFQIISSIVVGLFNFYVSVGQTLAFLKVARGQPAGIGDLFAGGPFFGRLFLASLVIGLIAGLIAGVCVVPGAILMASSGPQDVTAIAVLSLGILVATTVLSIYWIRISVYMYAGIDGAGLGAMDTVRRSMDLTRGHFWGISGVYLLLFLINIAGVLAIGIGLIFTVPLSFVIIATMYALLAGEPTAAEKPAPEFLG